MAWPSAAVMLARAQRYLSRPRADVASCLAAPCMTPGWVAFFVSPMSQILVRSPFCKPTVFLTVPVTDFCQSTSV